jgi:hypothetical protein
MFVAVGRPVARRNSAITSRPEKPSSAAARIFGVRDDAAHVAHQANGVLEQPAAVRVEGDARLREALVQRDDRLDLLFGAQGAALQLEVVEAVARVRGLGEPHHGLGRHRLLVAQPQPVVGGAGIAGIRQVGPRLVADVEEIAEHLHRLALLAFAEQRRHRNVEVLARADRATPTRSP